MNLTRISVLMNEMSFPEKMCLMELHGKQAHDRDKEAHYGTSRGKTAKNLCQKYPDLMKSTYSRRDVYGNRGHLFRLTDDGLALGLHIFTLVSRRQRI